MRTSAVTTVSPGPSRRDLVLLALLGAVLFLPGLGARDLWNPDEARYAEVAREMREADRWALPLLNGEVYAQKPPLLFWAIRAAAGLTGSLDETAARLPSALAGIGALLLVFLLGERLFGRRAAWLAALVYATCFKTFWQARFGQIDMLLGCLVALAVWCWLRGWTEGRPGFVLLFYLAAGLGTLAKGPVGLLPPLLSIVAFLLWERDRAGLKGLRLGWGLLLWAAVVLAWLVPAGLAGGREYLEQIIYKQNVTRYADPWHHRLPPWYYLTTLPADFLPWSLLLPTALVQAWRRARPGGTAESRGWRLALCWMMVTLVFFSVSPGKRTVYVFQMFPALALLVGAALDRLAADWPALSAKGRRWLTWPYGLLAGLSAVLLAALAVGGPRRPEAALFGGGRFVLLVVLTLLPLLLGAVWALLQQRAGRTGRAVHGLAAGAGLTFLLAALVLLPRFDVVKSARPMSRILRANLAEGEPYTTYPRLDAGFLFYTERFIEPVQGEQELWTFASRPGRVWVLIQRDDLEKLTLKLPLVEVARDSDPKTGYVLLGRPQFSPPALKREGLVPPGG
jgi:4-amino-4-deoxy-L-arabinose transferase-like glycosyltransferase